MRANLDIRSVNKYLIQSGLVSAKMGGSEIAPQQKFSQASYIRTTRLCTRRIKSAQHAILFGILWLLSKAYDTYSLKFHCIFSRESFLKMSAKKVGKVKKRNFVQLRQRSMSVAELLLDDERCLSDDDNDNGITGTFSSLTN